MSPPLVFAICEYYNPCLHGQDEDSSPNITGHILCAYIVPREKIFHRRKYPFCFIGMGGGSGAGSRSNSHKSYGWDVTQPGWDVTQTDYWKNNANGDFLDTVTANNLLAYGHPTIRNYFPIIQSRGIRSLEIVEMCYLEPGDECVCILKTCWLRIFQRKVRNWIQNRARVSEYLKRSRHLILRECGRL